MVEDVEMKIGKSFVSFLALALVAISFAASAQTLTWADIDCAKSNIVLERITKCREANAGSGSDGKGAYHYQTAAFTTANERAYVFVQRPFVEMEAGGIMVDAEARERYLSKPSAEAAKSASNFSSTMRMSGGHAKTYAMEGGWQCFSFAKDAPPMGRSNGVAYYLVGYDCRKGSQVPTADTINAFLQKVSVRR